MKSSLSPIRRLVLLGIPILYFLTFVEATYEKLAYGVPDWFLEKFAPTFFSAVPGGVSLSFYFLALAELAASLLASVAIVGVVLDKRFAAPAVLWTTVVSGWTFSALSFGMRLTKDYSSAAQLFYYAAFSFILYMLLDQDLKRQNQNQNQPADITQG